MIVINVTENKLVYRAKGQKYELLPGVGISVDDPRVVEAMKGFYKHNINVVDENTGADFYKKAVEYAKIQEPPVEEPKENANEGTVGIENDNTNPGPEERKKEKPEGTTETNTEDEGTTNPEDEKKAEPKDEVKVTSEKKAKQTKSRTAKSQSKKNKNSKK